MKLHRWDATNTHVSTADWTLFHKVLAAALIGVVVGVVWGTYIPLC